MNGSAPPKRHTVTITERSRIAIEGVSEVLRCEDTLIDAQTEEGELLLHGEGLRLGSFENAKGLLVVEGRLSALEYTDRGIKGKSLIARIFR